MKLKALIVDDEYPARKELRYMLDQFDNVEVVGEATNAREALKLIKAMDYSILFLDIEMPGMNGLELSAAIQESTQRPYIIFTTAYEEYAVKAFEVNAVDYLLKPFDEKRLAQAINKVIQLVEKNQAKGNRQLQSQQSKINGTTVRIDRIPVEKEGKTVLVAEDEIIFAYTENDNVYIKTRDECMLTRFTLKDLETRLDDKNFFRTHRCYIVNLTKVKEIIPLFNGTYILIVDDDTRSEVPVSRNQAKKLKKILGM
ncbi:LytR/AlgR family response regulator transcription factor [Calderihabitans maritimus]|uniref:Stage 0 sporulation protein A homolog n=1 Tax=Calderihabitans maritimus TaxID=1246530 RepID=A0A1Z5HT47_9FIRM|nr:LytTR family DNA-binding domain-containing protein [Calderihabitans maritimus]GAW92527.1 LytTR family two component transcriptional regulator [Calderihabitans maritimus]